SDASVRIAAVSSLATNPDDTSTDALLRALSDSDTQVRATALSTLAQVGSERAQQAIMSATRSGSTDERIAAIHGLAQIADDKATRQLASLMRDADPAVARAAISSSYNAGPEVEQTLVQIMGDPSASDDVKMMAAGQLRSRGAELDSGTQQVV